MYKTICQYLEKTAEKYPDKIAYRDKENSVTFSELQILSGKIGAGLGATVKPQQAIVVYMKKSLKNIISFLGIAYAGCYYVPIDEKMPLERVQLILNSLIPAMLIYDKYTETHLGTLHGFKNCVHYEDLLHTDLNINFLDSIRTKIKTTDLLYVLFTSGSTGTPKGVTISNAAVIDFLEWICTRYKLDENTSLCNQAPFYFDASVPDIFIPLKTGGTTYIPPAHYYTFPQKVIKYIIENNINTLIWVPSALCNVVNSKALDICIPECVSLVIFCGEVMPCKYLNKWRKTLPFTKYVNMYGPTEATYACTYYEIEREFADDEKLPLGSACDNCEILLLNGDRPVSDGEIGEICILGQCLSNGYYNDREKTALAFEQNPLNPFWSERMYRTGDLAVINETGELFFAGRKDSQIKKNGFRIELGEIESVIQSIPDIVNACCLFDAKNNCIIAVYSGEIQGNQLNSILETKLQKYMLPDRYIALPKMPMNINGKVDRTLLNVMVVEQQFTNEQISNHLK